MSTKDTNIAANGCTDQRPEASRPSKTKPRFVKRSLLSATAVGLCGAFTYLATYNNPRIMTRLSAFDYQHNPRERVDIDHMVDRLGDDWRETELRKIAETYILDAAKTLQEKGTLEMLQHRNRSSFGEDVQFVQLDPNKQVVAAEPRMPYEDRLYGSIGFDIEPSYLTTIPVSREIYDLVMRTNLSDQTYVIADMIDEMRRATLTEYRARGFELEDAQAEVQQKQARMTEAKRLIENGSTPPGP